MLYGHIIQIAA